MSQVLPSPPKTGPPELQLFLPQLGITEGRACHGAQLHLALLSSGLGTLDWKRLEASLPGITTHSVGKELRAAQGTAVKEGN